MLAKADAQRKDQLAHQQDRGVVGEDSADDSPKRKKEAQYPSDPTTRAHASGLALRWSPTLARCSQSPSSRPP
jgi:hypothetical protein